MCGHEKNSQVLSKPIKLPLAFGRCRVEKCFRLVVGSERMQCGADGVALSPALAIGRGSSSEHPHGRARVLAAPFCLRQPFPPILELHFSTYSHSLMLQDSQFQRWLWLNMTSIARWVTTSSIEMDPISAPRLGNGGPWQLQCGEKIPRAISDPTATLLIRLPKRSIPRRMPPQPFCCN